MDKPPMHPIMAFLAGLLTMALLCALIWAMAALVIEGIPAEDRADLVSVIVLSSVGLVATALMGAASANGRNPLEVVAGALTALRGLVRR